MEFRLTYDLTTEKGGRDLFIIEVECKKRVARIGCAIEPRELVTKGKLQIQVGE